jgi:hypothetical protein
MIIVIPSVIYAIHAAIFGTWVVDDAGITFAYARSFAQGYGLVSQPGMAPVEGYSNFAWLMLLSPLFLLNGLDPAIVSKVISFLLIVGTFTVIFQMLKPLSGRHWVAFAAFILTALNTSFVVWTISGLENPLYLFLVSVMLWWSMRILEGEIGVRRGLWMGILAALIAMTRPDGLAYVLTLPAILIPAPATTWKRKGITLLTYGAAFVGLYGLFIGFRLAYFGVPMPNTYYMKGGPELQDVIDLLTVQPQIITNAQKLLESFVGRFNDMLPLVLVAGTLYLLIARQWSGRAWAILVFLLCSLSVYLLLPPDWMGEYRFATVFFFLSYLYSALIIEAIVNRLPSRIDTLVAIVLTAIAVTATFSLYAPRSEAFRQHPTVPFQNVRVRDADRFNWYKQTLGLETASVLMPDVGAMLYYSDLTVYDLAGLTDQAVARYLGTNINRSGFYNYVFEIVTPTFIHTHGFWTQHTKLEDDPRFTELYVPICAFTDPWIQRNWGISRQSGDFILRSIAEAHLEDLEILRQGLDENCHLKR